MNNKGWVLDTSVLVQFYMEEGEVHARQARKMLVDLSSGGRLRDVTIPTLAIIELANVLIKSKGVAQSDVYEILRDIYNLGFQVVETDIKVLNKAADVCFETGMTMYDAIFLAVADEYGKVLISDDKKGHGKVKNESVVMLEDFKM